MLFFLFIHPAGPPTAAEGFETILECCNEREVVAALAAWQRYPAEDPLTAFRAAKRAAAADFFAAKSRPARSPAAAATGKAAVKQPPVFGISLTNAARTAAKQADTIDLCSPEAAASGAPAVSPAAPPAQWQHQREGGQAQSGGEPAVIDADFLAALPPELRAEVIQQHKQGLLPAAPHPRSTSAPTPALEAAARRAAAAPAPAPSWEAALEQSGASPATPGWAATLAALPADVRNEALLQAGEAALATLPPALQARAYELRGTAPPVPAAGAGRGTQLEAGRIAAGSSAEQGGSRPATVAAPSAEGAAAGSAAPGQLTLLTWNVNDECCSHFAPPGWSLERQRKAVVAEILRHAPHVAALQELFDLGLWWTPHMAAAGYDALPATAESHRGLVALFVRRGAGITVERLESLGGLPGPPAVVARLKGGPAGDAGVVVATCHLWPGECRTKANPARRLDQLTAIVRRSAASADAAQGPATTGAALLGSRAGSDRGAAASAAPPQVQPGSALAAPLVIAGDFNMREEETGPAAGLGLTDAFIEAGQPGAHRQVFTSCYKQACLV